MKSVHVFARGQPWKGGDLSPSNSEERGVYAASSVDISQALEKAPNRM